MSLATGIDGRVAELCAKAPMPAVAVGLIDSDGVAYTHVHGMADIYTGESVTPEHLWDLASLTKVLVTLPEVLDLVEVGKLDLDEKLAGQWSRAVAQPVGDATLRQLLSFDAGLPASVEWYRQGFTGRDLFIDAVMSTALERASGSVPVYSDVGMIMLGELVNDFGKSLDELALSRTGLQFGPVSRPVVATEDCPWRGQLVKGEVHDENAFALGGVAGHAGAFGTIQQVLNAVSDWWARTAELGSVWSDAVTEQSRNDSNERFGLGWWLCNTRQLGGLDPGPLSWGASGFVGNRIWIEPERGYGVVVLSNRVHPIRRDRADYNAWCVELLSLIAESET